MSGSVEELIQKDAIIDMVTSIFILTDERDWEKIKGVFSEEVLFDMTSMSGGSPSRIRSQQIIDGWRTGLKDLKAIHHQVGNFKVNVREKDADVFCYGIALHYLPNPTNVNVRRFVGAYDIHMVKLKSEWKIDGFKYNLKFIDGNKDLEASAGK